MYERKRDLATGIRSRFSKVDVRLENPNSPRE
jgi:hypothetical protein